MLERASLAFALCLALAGCGDFELVEAQPAPERQAASARTVPPTAALDEAFASPEACDGLPTQTEARAAGELRFASWNVRWFPNGSADAQRHGSGTNLRWLACTIAAMDLDIVAVQEFVRTAPGRAAERDLLRELNRLTGGRWESRFDSCNGDGRQHMGYLFRADRLAVETRVIADVNPNGGACKGRLRPGLLASVTAADGQRLHIINVHLDSGTVARDYDHRAISFERIAALSAEFARTEPGASFFAVGDFNTMGCASCEPAVDDGREKDQLDRALLRGGSRLEQLSSDDGCTEVTSRHVSVLDHVYARLASRQHHASAGVAGPCASSCERSTARRHPFFSELSDHCPLVVELSWPVTR